MHCCVVARPTFAWSTSSTASNVRILWYSLPAHIRLSESLSHFRMLHIVRSARARTQCGTAWSIRAWKCYHREFRQTSTNMIPNAILDVWTSIEKCIFPIRITRVAMSYNVRPTCPIPIRTNISRWLIPTHRRSAKGKFTLDPNWCSLPVCSILPLTSYSSADFVCFSLEMRQRLGLSLEWSRMIQIVESKFLILYNDFCLPFRVVRFLTCESQVVNRNFWFRTSDSGVLCKHLASFSNSNSFQIHSLDKFNGNDSH